MYLVIELEETALRSNAVYLSFIGAVQMCILHAFIKLGHQKAYSSSQLLET